MSTPKIQLGPANKDPILGLGPYAILAANPRSSKPVLPLRRNLPSRVEMIYAVEVIYAG